MLQIAKEKGVTVLKVAGNIDERFQPPAVQLAKIDPVSVEIDCSAVGDINSIGTRHWINFLGALPKGCTYSFRGCRDNFLAYARFVPLFTNGAKIHSFFIPFECDACN